MEILFTLVITAVLIAIVEIVVSKQKNKITISDIDPCPPHKWRQTELKDKEGNSSGHWKIICDKCGPLRSIEKDDNSEESY